MQRRHQRRVVSNQFVLGQIIIMQSSIWCLISVCVPVGMQLFALYNHTGEMNTSLRFYSLRVPLQVQKEAGLITDVDTHWLDHMTQHFTSGAHLIDGFFQLGDDNGRFSGHRN